MIETLGALHSAASVALLLDHVEFRDPDASFYSRGPVTSSNRAEGPAGLRSLSESRISLGPRANELREDDARCSRPAQAFGFHSG
jgi:hypothetical protein